MTNTAELIATLKGDHVCGGIGSCWVQHEMREAAALIERMQATLRGTLLVIDQVAPKQPPEMQAGFKAWREQIVVALGDAGA